MESGKTTENGIAVSVSNSNDRLRNYFRSAISKTVDRFLTTLSFKLLKRYFESIYADDPGSLLDIHNQLTSHLRANILQNIKEICKEMKVPSSLRILDAVIGKHENMPKELSWRPAGDPEIDLRDHIYKIKLQQKEKMLKLLKDLETERKHIQAIVNENHLEIMNIKKEIDDKNTKLQNHLNIMNHSTSQDLEAMLQSINSANIIESH